MALRPVEAALHESSTPPWAVELAPEEPIIVTGGARGITAAVAADLARRWRPTLLLVGTSPPPPDHEAPATAGIEAVAELKRALHESLTRQDRSFGPAELERAYLSLRRQREIRANLERFRLVEDLFLPEDPKGIFSVWHAVSFRSDGKLDLKVYLNLQARGRALAPALGMAVGAPFRDAGRRSVFCLCEGSPGVAAGACDAASTAAHGGKRPGKAGPRRRGHRGGIRQRFRRWAG